MKTITFFSLDSIDKRDYFFDAFFGGGGKYIAVPCAFCPSALCLGSGGPCGVGRLEWSRSGRSDAVLPLASRLKPGVRPVAGRAVNGACRASP